MEFLNAIHVRKRVTRTFPESTRIQQKIFRKYNIPLALFPQEKIQIVRASSIGPAQWSGNSIMDSDADDTLEGLIVGNDPPKDTRLTTLFLDLEKTFVFMTCREAKNLYAAKKYKAAAKLFSSLVSMAPSNILYRVWLARSLTRIREYRKAKVHYNAALILCARRVPAQRLFTVRRELDELAKRRAASAPGPAFFSSSGGDHSENAG